MALVVLIAAVSGWASWGLRPVAPHPPDTVQAGPLRQIRVAVDKPRDVSVMAVPVVPQVPGQAFTQDVIVVNVEARKGETVNWAVELDPNQPDDLDDLAPTASLGQTEVPVRESNSGWLVTGR